MKKVISFFMVFSLVLGFFPFESSLRVYADGVSAPVISPNGGEIKQNSEITITAESGNVYYTTDGSTPSLYGTLYTEPFTLSSGETTVRAVAVDEGEISSETSAEFEFAPKGEVSVSVFGTSYSDSIQEVAAAGDGGYIAVGHSSFPTVIGSTTYYYADAAIVKYDADGSIEWQSTLGGSGTDSYYSAACTPDGGYVAVGKAANASFGNGDLSSLSGKGNIDSIIVKYDSAGNLEWMRNFGGSGDDVFNGVTADETGYIAVGYCASGSFGTGDLSSISGYGGYDAVIVKYDTDGGLSYVKKFGGSGSDYFESIITDNEGYYIVVGYSSSSYSGDLDISYGYSDAVIVKYNPDGSRKWRRQFGSTAADYFSSVALCSDGGYIAVGRSEGGFGNNDLSGLTAYGSMDAVIAKYTSSGTLSWKNNFGGSGNDAFYYIAAMERGFAAVGYSREASFGTGCLSDISGKGNNDGIIVRYDDSGNAVYKNNFGGSYAENYISCALTPSGLKAAAYIASANSFGTGDLAGYSGYGDTDAVFVNYNFADVVFDPNGGEFDTEFQSAPAGEAFTLSSDVPTKEGSVFCGWSESKYLSVAEYHPGDKLTLSNDLYLYAVWDVSQGQTAAIEGKQTVYPGEDFTQTLYFTPGRDTALVSLKVTYPEIFTYEGFETGLSGISVSAADGSLTVIGDFSSGNAAADSACILGKLKFKAAGDCEEGEYSLGFDSAESYILDSAYSVSSFDSLSGITVSVVPVEALYITVSGESEIYQSSDYTAFFFPLTTSDKEVVWSVSDETIASIDEYGTLTPVSNGTITVSAAASNGVSGSLEVTVAELSAAVDSITSDVGSFAAEYSPRDYERTLYVPPSTTVINLTAVFDSGTLIGTKGVSGIFTSGTAKSAAISSLPAEITLFRADNNQTSATYTIYVCAAGDVNSDGYTDDTDAVLVLRDVSGIEALSDDGQRARGDYDGDGTLTITDSTGILKNR